MLVEIKSQTQGYSSQKEVQKALNISIVGDIEGLKKNILTKRITASRFLRQSDRSPQK